MFYSFLCKTSRLALPKCKLCRELISKQSCFNNESLWNEYIIRKLHSSRAGELGQTILIVQDGTDLQELPYVVRRLSAKDASVLLFDGKSGKTGNSDYSDSGGVTGSSSSNENLNDSSFTLDNDDRIVEEELTEIIKGFEKCNSTKELLQLLGTVPSNYVLPNVALRILVKMITLEKEKPFVIHTTKSDGYSNVVTTNEEKKSSDNFTEKAVSNQLMEIILSNKDCRVLVNTLKLMNEDAAVRKFLSGYKKDIDNTILLNATENKYSICEICDIIKQYHLLNDPVTVDKFWFGIAEKSNEIDRTNIMRVFHILPYLKRSRRIILNTLAVRFTLEWWRVTGSDIAEILAILKETNVNAYRILQVIGRWLNTNIHTVSEDDLLKIVSGLRTIEFINSPIERALERYLKAKYDKIRNANLIASIMDYAVFFRWRSTVILDICERYLVDNDTNDTISPSVFKSLFVPFGILSYQPSNPLQFWKCVERIIERKFSQYEPKDILDIMLACVYSNKYPLNFVNEIFSPYFLGKVRAYSVCSATKWNILKSKLKILDTTMYLNCDSYDRLKLPVDCSFVNVKQEFRVQKMTATVQEYLLPMVDQTLDRIMHHVSLPILPLTPLHLIDVLLLPENLSASNLADRRHFDESFVAILINLPEHYCSDGLYLIGPQVLRKNNLKVKGLKVASLNYSILQKHKHEPKELAAYVNECLTNCE